MTADKHAQAQELARRLKSAATGGVHTNNVTIEQAKLLIEAASMIDALLREWPKGEPYAWIEHHKGGNNLVWSETTLPCTPLYLAATLPRAPGFSEVWEVGNRTTSLLFETEADADEYIALQSAASGLTKCRRDILRASAK